MVLMKIFTSIFSKILAIASHMLYHGYYFQIKVFRTTWAHMTERASELVKAILASKRR